MEDRLLAGQTVLRIGLDAGHVVGGVVERLAHAAVVAAQMVDGAMVGDAEQPRAQRGHARQVGQQVVGACQCVLHDVLAVDHRTGHACAVAVQFRAQVGHQRQELPTAFVQAEQPGVLFFHHAATSSSEAMP